MTLTRKGRYFHPACELELIELVNMARRANRKIRVHGSGHAVAHAIYADPLDDIPNRVDRKRRPAGGKNLDIVLDRYADYSVESEVDRIVVVQAGMHLGESPGQPGGAEADGLLFRLDDEHGWTLPATGGITHQTLSGFIATASAGGSLQHSLDDCIIGVRIIDGAGKVHDWCRNCDPEFHAAVPNLGVLGIVSTIRLQCVDAFHVQGQEAIVPASGSRVVDLFGEGTGVPLPVYLGEQEYARIEWWPQGKQPRVVLWTSSRAGPPPGNECRPYVQFEHGDAEQAVISLVFTVLDKHTPRGLLPVKTLAQVEALTKQMGPQLRQEAADLARQLGPAGKYFAAFFEDCPAEARARYAAEGFRADWLKKNLPTWFPSLLQLFVPFDADGSSQEFWDEAWHGLPTDFAAKDQWIPVEFTEMWLPLDRAQEAMCAVRRYFDEPDDELARYQRTGTFAFELYAHKPSSFWLHPAHSSGSDDWQDGAFRFNAYWFRRNADDPLRKFFPSFWDVLRRAGIPFRLHWGKFLPSTGNDPNWQHAKATYGRWDAFLQLRRRLDPNAMFLNRYWADHLGIDPPQSQEFER